MKLQLIDYGKGIGGLEGLLLPLESEFSFINLGVNGELINANWLARLPFYKSFKLFNKWAQVLSNQVPDEVIGLALMPYQPTEKELGIDSFIYHSRIIPTGLNYNKLVLLNSEVLSSIDLLLKVAIHEVSDVLSRSHYTHDGSGLPCANNGDVNFGGGVDQSVGNTIHYLKSVSPWLCDDCKRRIKDRLTFFEETDRYVSKL